LSEIILRSDYEPSGKGIEFHKSSAKYKVLVGGLGSGKTRMAVEELIVLMSENPGIEIFVMRKTMPSLRDSTLNEFLKLIPSELGKFNHRTDTFYCVNNAKLMFRGLDEPSKIKSTNVSIIVLDEAEEFTFEDFITLKGRIRQMKPDGAAYPHHFILILNPVDDTHWIYKQFVTNASQYQDTGGLLLLVLSTYDNLKHLPSDYIQTVTAGLSAQEIERFIFGKWGSIVKGSPVYADVFNPGIHLVKWNKDSSHLLLRGWDFGYNHPAVSFRLKDPMGRKNIDHEVLGAKKHLDVFAKEILGITERRYGKILVFDYCDPRGFDKSDKGQSSVDVLNDLGVYPVGERGVRSYVEPGVRLVRNELSTLIQGVPELTVNPECAMMRAVFGGRYVRDEKTGEPQKDGYYEHIADADRYIAYNDKSNSVVKEAILNRMKRVQERPRNRHTGY
jgi:hypothetical protein